MAYDNWERNIEYFFFFLNNKGFVNNIVVELSVKALCCLRPTVTAHQVIQRPGSKL